MSSLSAKDRVSLCQFTFSDGRRCRTPRTGKNPHFCFDHAQKEDRARTAQSLGKDLAYFFSGDYLSARDLSSALGRLIPAVLRGDVKPRTARTVACLAQTLLQTIHISQHEYVNAFSTDTWRKAIRSSVYDCYNNRRPPTPKPAPSPDQAPHVVAGLPRSVRPGSTGKTGGVQAPQPVGPPANCHSGSVAQAGICPDRVGKPEESASPSNSLLTTRHFLKPHNRPHRRTLPCHPRAPNSFSRSWPVFQPAPCQPLRMPDQSHPTLNPAKPPRRQPLSPLALEQDRRVNPREPNRDAPWLHWGDQSHIRPDSKLV